MATFSTRKRKNTEASVSALEDAFNTGAAEAGKTSKWKAFSESKPVQALKSGTKAFVKWTASKTASAAKWTGTKIKDAAYDTARGAKAFGKSFAESYHDRQEVKKTNKFIKGCEERGFVVMAKEDFSKAFQNLQEMQHVMSESDTPIKDPDINMVDLDTTVIRMSESLRRYTDTNGVTVSDKDTKSEPTISGDTVAADVSVTEPAEAKKSAFAKPVATYFITDKDVSEASDALKTDGSFKKAGDLPVSSGADKSAEGSSAFHTPEPLSASSVKNDFKDAANNGSKSAKLSEQLVLMREALLARCKAIEETLTKVSEAKTETDKSKIANDYMKSLKSDMFAMGKTASDQLKDINGWKSGKNNSNKNRGKELDLLVEPADDSRSADVEAGV